VNKCFGIGLSRTGTKSLNEALCRLGIRAVHFPMDALSASEVIAGRPYSLLRWCDGLTDLQAALRYRELDAQYPGSKFILTVREKTSWLESCRKHCLRYRPEDQPQPVRGMIETQHLKMYGIIDFDATKWSAAYDRHVREVREHFRGRNDLLVMDITAGEGWSRLCPFLGKPIPNRPFPRDR
jgi:hypothetical protein